MVARLVIIACLALLAISVGDALFAGVNWPRPVQMGLIFILLVVGVLSTRGRRRDLLLGASGLWFGLAALEVACMVMEPAPTLESDGGRTATRPIVGWGASHPGVFHDIATKAGRLLFDVQITIDEQLLRKTIGPTGARGLVFFGDSMTFGDGIDDADTLPQSYVDLRKGTEAVRNLAYSGWSPAQNLATLQFDLAKAVIDRPRRFILTTAAWHAERSSCRTSFWHAAPRYVIVDGEPRYEGPCYGPTRSTWIRFLMSFAAYRMILDPMLSRISGADVDLYVKIVETFTKTARTKYGVPTTIILLPVGDAHLKSTGWTQAAIAQAFRRGGADVIVDRLPPIADPKLYEIQGNGHPTGLANRARAKELADHLDLIERTPLAHEGTRP